METEQYATKQPTDYRRSQRGSKNHDLTSGNKKNYQQTINLTPKAAKEKEQTEPKVGRKKEIINIGDETSKLEVKTNRKRTIKPRAGFLKR